MSFLDELEKNTNEATTLNGAKTNRSSLSPCLDFFALGAAKRNQIDDAVMLFHKAYLSLYNRYILFQKDRSLHDALL